MFKRLAAIVLCTLVTILEFGGMNKEDIYFLYLKKKHRQNCMLLRMIVGACLFIGVIFDSKLYTIFKIVF